MAYYDKDNLWGGESQSEEFAKKFAKKTHSFMKAEERTFVIGIAITLA